MTWAYEEPATKSQRLTDASGNVMAAVDLDPWGLETSRSWNSQQQTHRYTTYERDGNQSDDAMARRYNRWHLRFDQPDPYDGSYDLTDPRSLNRYSYTEGDPVNFTDPSGTMASVDCNNPENRSKCSDPGIIPDNSWDWMERWLNQYDYLSGLIQQKSGVEFLPPDGSYGENGQKLIRETLANIVFSDKCAKAFKDAGLKTPFELLMKGIVVGPATLLTDPSNVNSIGITEAARQRDFGVVGSTSVQAITVRDHPGFKPDTTDGRARIFLNTSAFGGGAYPLAEVLTHELIHVAGVDAKPPGFFGSIIGRHDLSYYDKYQSIIDACK